MTYASVRNLTGIEKKEKKLNISNMEFSDFRYPVRRDCAE